MYGLVGVWVISWVSVGWMGQWVVSVQITKNLINLDLTKIIQFCLKIYDLWRYPQLWVGGWVGGWMDGWLGRCLGYVKLLKIESILN